MRKALLFVLVSVCFLGCSYNFSDDNYIDLGEPNLEGSSINLYTFNNGDIINVSKEFSYEIMTSQNQYGILTEIYVDNERISSSSGMKTGTFTLRPQFYGDGEHTIRIIHEFNSGTGSIAEQQQRETITAIKDFQFIVNRKPSTPPAISARIENGSITLEWDYDNTLEFETAYINLQFLDYQRTIPLSAAMFSKGSYVDTHTVLFPLNDNQRESEDRSKVTYSMVLVSEFEELLGQGADLEHDPSWLDVSISFVDLEHYMISWPRHPLYTNFDSYEILISSGVIASTQGGEELIEEPYSFGEDYLVYLDPQTSFDQSVSSYRTRLRLDETTFLSVSNMQLNDGRDFIFNPSTQKYYLLAMEENAVGFNYGITIFEYSSNLEFIKKTVLLELVQFWSGVGFKMEMDPETNNFYVDIRYQDENLEVIYTTMEFDKFNLSKLKEFSDQGSGDSKSLQLRGSILKKWDFDTKILTLVNVETDENFLSTTVAAYNFSHLSNDGKYIYLKFETEVAIYEIKGSSLEKRVVLANQPSYYSFCIYDDTLYYAEGSNTLKIIALNTGQTIKTINYESGSTSGYDSMYYDSLSNRILFVKGSNGYLMNIDSGQLSKFSYVSNKEFGWLGDEYFVWLTNGKLIYSKGIYVEVQ